MAGSYSAYKAEWYQRNKERIKAKLKDKYQTDPEHRQTKVAYANKYREDNKEHILKHDRERSRLKRQDPEYREWKRTYDRIREHRLYATDLNFAIMKRLRSRIRRVLESDFALKSASTMELIGCNLEQLKVYLTGTFTEGMSWALLDRLAIDHIQPCCSFDLTKPEEQRKCFHYTNLRPLWAEENWAKVAQDKRQMVA